MYCNIHQRVSYGGHWGIPYFSKIYRPEHCSASGGVFSVLCVIYGHSSELLGKLPCMITFVLAVSRWAASFLRISFWVGEVSVLSANWISSIFIFPLKSEYPSSVNLLFWIIHLLACRVHKKCCCWTPGLQTIWSFCHLQKQRTCQAVKKETTIPRILRGKHDRGVLETV